MNISTQSKSTNHAKVVVVGGGYASVMAAQRLTQRDDISVTLINPRASFVHRNRLQQMLAETDTEGVVVDFSENACRPGGTGRRQRDRD